MKTIRAFSVLLCTMLLVLAMACSSGPTTNTNTNTNTQNPCAAGTDCASCLAISQCNWTGDQCSPECLQDTSCFGPGNSSAPSCP
ncbi:MAG: hypothetical protein EP343_34405 [Deltaproteobacteria bacterium]|nr:MAG: hypothetical protein EP343_34405 [Deltaproteobacteria bacterium]